MTQFRGQYKLRSALPEGTEVRFQGTLGNVTNPQYAYESEHYIPVLFLSSLTPSYIFYQHLETPVAVEEKPPPVTLKGTNVYSDTLSGAVYQTSGGCYVCINAVKPSIPIGDHPPESMVRLYREV